MVLGLGPVAGVRAATPDSTRSVESLQESWAAPGLPGFVDDVHLGNGLAFRFLGVTAGGVGLRDGLLPASRPWPGVDEIAAPRAWFDSAAAVVGEAGGWRGFGASIVELRGFASIPRQRRPRAVFTYVTGSSAIERAGLLLQRGDRDSWMRGGALTEQRLGAGLMGQRSQHVWFLDTGKRRGEHTISGTFSQRGAANGTEPDADAVLGPFRPPFSGLEESSRGEAGSLEWAWEHAGRRLRSRLERSHDRRESFEAVYFDVFAEREAQENGVSTELTLGEPGHERGLRLDLRRSQVERSEDFLGDVTALRPAHVDDERSAWLAVRAQRPLRGGRLEAQLGAGYASAPERNAERVQAAPSVVWEAGGQTRRLRVYGERVVTPVWSDLALNVRPFVQDTWLAGFTAGLGSPSRHWLELGALGATIANRAELQPWPVRDVALRYGWRKSGLRVNDALLTMAGGLAHGDYGLAASLFARTRSPGQLQALVDPAFGAHASAEGGFRVFAGDLGVKLKLEAAWVGPRDNESLPEYSVFPRPIDGYVTFAGHVAIALGDARLRLRGVNLEDVGHPQVWTDPTSPFPGVIAVSAGRKLLMELVWPLYN